MDSILFFILFSLLCAASIWIGKRSSKNIKTTDDYFLMGRTLGPFSLVMTFLATQIGGGSLMGAAEEAYLMGWSVLFYPLGMVIGMAILGLGFGAKMRKLGLSTIAELFERVYRAPRLRQFASALSIVSLFFILVGQAIAARKFFLSLEMGGEFLFIAFWAVLVFYTVLGGLKAVISTDILQALFIMGAFAVACFSLGKGASLPVVEWTPSGSPPWMAWLLLPLLFMLISQDMGQRCFASKNPKTISLAACIAALVFFCVALCPIYVGQLAARVGLEIPEGGSVLITSVKALTSPIVSTCVILAILMAIISTSDSLLCSISSNACCDFKHGSVRSSQWVTFCVGMVTLALSYVFNNVVGMLMFSYELSVSLLAVPIILGVLLPHPSRRSAEASIIVGAFCFLLFRFVEPPLPKELLTLSCSLGAYFTFWRRPVTVEA